MKKYFLLGLMIAIAPNICFGAGARYTQLVREKQRKMEELEKCMGATNGLKIAGLSTIGLTAVGVAGNVVQAKKLDEYESGIESKQKELEKVNKDIAEKQAEIKKAKEAEEAKKKATVPQQSEQLYRQNVGQEDEIVLPANIPESDAGLKCHGSGGNWDESSKTCDCGVNTFEDGECKDAEEIVIDLIQPESSSMDAVQGSTPTSSPSNDRVKSVPTSETEPPAASKSSDDVKSGDKLVNTKKEKDFSKSDSKSPSTSGEVNQSPKKTSSNNTASKATSGNASSKIYQNKINLAHNATEVSSRSYTGVCERGTLSNNFVRQKYACTTESTGNWITKFDSYTAKGGSYCAGNKKDTVYTAGTPSGSGSNCWCKVTNSAGNNSWVYTSFVPNCSADCAYHCAYQLGTYEKFRREALLY